MNRISRLFLLSLWLAGAAAPALAADAASCLRDRAWAEQQRHLDEAQISDMVAGGQPVAVPRHLHRMLRELVAASPRLRKGPAIHLIGFVDTELNAYAADHGLVIFTSAMWDPRHGLSQHELAAVLAHELAHIEARDGLREVCELAEHLGHEPEGVEQVRAMLARESFNPASPLARQAAHTLQQQELRADARAIELLRSTGRPPGAMVSALVKLHAPASQGAALMLAPTHPGMEERLAHARDLLKAR